MPHTRRINFELHVFTPARRAFALNRVLHVARHLGDEPLVTMLWEALQYDHETIGLENYARDVARLVPSGIPVQAPGAAELEHRAMQGHHYLLDIVAYVLHHYKGLTLSRSAARRQLLEPIYEQNVRLEHHQARRQSLPHAAPPAATSTTTGHAPLAPRNSSPLELPV